MAAWPHGWLPLIGAGLVQRGGRVMDRAEPGRASGAAGVLDAPPGAPIMAGQGKAAGSGRGLYGYGHPIAGWSGWQARWLPSSLRVCPGLAGRGAWGGPRQIRAGPITTTSAPPRPAWKAPVLAGDRQRSGHVPGRPAAHAAGLMARRTCPSRRP